MVFLARTVKKTKKNHRLGYISDTRIALPSSVAVPWWSWIPNSSFSDRNVPAMTPAQPVHSEEVRPTTTPQPRMEPCPFGCGTYLTVARTGILGHVHDRHGELVPQHNGTGPAPRMNARQVTCPRSDCNKTMRWSSFAQHILDHITAATGVVACPVCGETFMRRINYIRHVQNDRCRGSRAPHA